MLHKYIIYVLLHLIHYNMNYNIHDNMKLKKKISKFQKFQAEKGCEHDYPGYYPVWLYQKGEYIFS